MSAGLHRPLPPHPIEGGGEGGWLSTISMGVKEGESQEGRDEGAKQQPESDPSAIEDFKSDEEAEAKTTIS